MLTRSARWFLVLAFAAAVGHLAWHAVIGPPSPNYVVGGPVTAMGSLSPKDKNLYLRRTVHLSQKPRHAWIQLLGRDELTLHVNGTLVEQVALPTYPVAIVADLTTYLHEGRNVIAITARQSSIATPPVAAVEGAYVLNDSEHRLTTDPEWRYSAVFERGAVYWFEPDFDDQHWPRVALRSAELRAEVRHPPRAMQLPSKASWVGSPSLHDRTVIVCREFPVGGRPRSAWLRVTATSSYRLAVNGVLVDQQEDQLATEVPVLPTQRVYDITPLAQGGTNTLTLLLRATAGPPRLRADLEVETPTERVYLATDGDWQCRPGPAPDWQEVAPTAAWQPCAVEKGDLAMPPWAIPSLPMQVVLPAGVRLGHAAGQLALIALVVLLTYLACLIAERLLHSPFGSRMEACPTAAVGAVYLALVPATVGLAIALLATFDPKVSAAAVYRGGWVLLAIASVPLQWAALGFFRSRSPRPEYRADPAWREVLGPLGVAATLVALAVAGFWLRCQEIEAEPLHWDEVTNVIITDGFRRLGFPCNPPWEGKPTIFLNTNELSHTFAGLSSLLFEDARWVVRFPGVCWSVLTTLLLYVAGRSMFRTWTVGLVAAGIHAFAPVVIAVSGFGRYFAVLQFFTLLTVFGFWHIMRGTGPVNHRALWLTTLGLIGLFLSWEGGALIAPALVLAMLLVGRKRVRTILGDGQVWLALVVAVLVVMLQLSHRTLQQTQSIWAGISASDAGVKPMWPFAIYQPWYYLFESSWNQDAFIPLLLLAGAGVLALRHPWRQPVRFLLVTHVAACLITASLLTIVAWRYTHHLVPLGILLGTAAIVAGTHGLVRIGRRTASRLAEVVHARAIGVGVLVAVLVAGNGLVLRLPKLELFRVQGIGQTQLKYVNIAGPNLFLKEHVRAGDVVLTNQPYTTNFFVGRVRADYWLQTTLYMTETLEEGAPRAVDRRDGTPVLHSIEALAALFAAHRRIWLVGAPSGLASANRAGVSAFLREHMDVVYEDYKSVVLFRNANRPAFLREQNQKALGQASITLLP
jgi:hypothetical protein